MSTYSLSGSGTHALTASTTGLQVTITTPSVVQGVGTANPANHYHTGMLRFSDGVAYWNPVPVTGGPQFIPVPQNASSFGYSMQGGAVISVTEVIGGTVFFSGGGSAALSGLTDVLVSSPGDGQLLQWNASAARWENATPAAGGGLTLIQAITVAGSDAADVTFSAIPGTYSDLRLVLVARTSNGAGFDMLAFQLNGDTGSHYDRTVDDSGGVFNDTSTQGRIGYVSGSGATAGEVGAHVVELLGYAGTVWRKTVASHGTSGGSLFRSNRTVTSWADASAITSVKLFPEGSSFKVGSMFRLYGVG